MALPPSFVYQVPDAGPIHWPIGRCLTVHGRLVLSVPDWVRAIYCDCLAIPRMGESPPYKATVRVEGTVQGGGIIGDTGDCDEFKWNIYYLSPLDQETVFTLLTIETDAPIYVGGLIFLRRRG